MATEYKYADLSALERFLTKLKTIFASITHTHDVSEINGTQKITIKTEDEWNTINPVLETNEIAVSFISNGSSSYTKYKVGDGTTTWSALNYNDAESSNYASMDSSGNSIESYYLHNISVTENKLVAEYGDGTSKELYTAANMCTSGEELLASTNTNDVAGAVAVKEAIASGESVVSYETPDSYTAPTSGISLKTFMGQVTKGLSDIFTNIPDLMPKSGGTFTGQVNFNSYPKALYGGSYLTMPVTVSSNVIELKVNSSNQLEIWIDHSIANTIGKSVLNGYGATFSTLNISNTINMTPSNAGISLGSNIYIYNNGSGQLWCRTGTSGSYKYKQLAP